MAEHHISYHYQKRRDGPKLSFSQLPSVDPSHWTFFRAAPDHSEFQPETFMNIPETAAGSM
jgi:hypothetical protein